MESPCAEHEKRLMEVMVVVDSPEVCGNSAAHRGGYFKCAVALVTVMGLIIVALGGFFLHISMSTLSCNQEPPPLTETATTCKLTKSDKPGRYDIFTVDEAATYMIYGFVKFQNATNEEVVLKQTLDGEDVTIQKEYASKTEVFFLEKARLVDGIRVSVYFNSNYNCAAFHYFKL